jgi:hypothetical protein
VRASTSDTLTGLHGLLQGQFYLSLLVEERQLYKTIILPAVLYGSDSWALSKAHEALLGGFESLVLRRIYVAVQIDGVWRRRYNKELYTLFNDVHIIKRIKINRLRWAGHVTSRENQEITKN